MKDINSVSFDITYNCNFRCKHCYNSSGERCEYTELSDETVRKIAKDIVSHTPDSMCICGGEPLLRKDLACDIARIIKKDGPSTSVAMVTNGFLMTEEIALELKESGIERIQISLDGATSQSHDWLRRPGSFDAALKAIECLKKAGVDYAVAFSPTRKNIGELEQAIDLAYSLGCSEFRIRPLMMLGRAISHPEDFKISYMEYMKAKYILDEKNQEYIDNNYKCTWGDPLSHLRLSQNLTFYHLIISAEGNLLASPYLPISFGNVINHSIEEYVNAGIFNVLRDNKLAYYMADKITSVDDMSLQDFGFSGKNDSIQLSLDLLDPNYEEQTQKSLDDFIKNETETR